MCHVAIIRFLQSPQKVTAVHLSTWKDADINVSIPVSVLVNIQYSLCPWGI